MITDEGAKALVSAMIAGAVGDLDKLLKNIDRIKKHHQSGTLAEYLRGKIKNNVLGLVPFWYAKTDLQTIEFFKPSNKWGRNLLEFCDIYSMPENIQSKMNEAMDYYKSEMRQEVEDIIKKERLMLKIQSIDKNLESATL
jgi:hypothetical protein